MLPVLVAASCVTFWPPYVNGPPIRSDGLGYYAWNDAIVTGNYDFCQWAGELVPVGAITGHNPGHPNRCEEKYPPGMALLRLPVMGTVVAIDGGASTLFVYGVEMEFSLWCGVAALLVTVFLMAMTMRRIGVRPVVADLTALGVCFGTGLFHYGTYDSSFSHVYSASLFAGLTFVGVSASVRDRRPNPLLVLLLVLLIGLTRQPDLIVVLILASIWVVHSSRPGPRRERALKAIVALPPVIAGMALSVGWQVFYNHWATGRWTLSSYGNEPISLGQLAELKVLFSYNHGVFVWYPIIAVLLTAALSKRESRHWGYLAVAVMVAVTVLYGSWNPWFLNGAFGARGFVDVVPILGVAGGVGINALKRRRQFWALAVSVVCVTLTIELMGGYWGESLPDDNPSAQQYWQHVVGSDSVLGPLGT